MQLIWLIINPVINLIFFFKCPDNIFEEHDTSLIPFFFLRVIVIWTLHILLCMQAGDASLSVCVPSAADTFSVDPTAAWTLKLCNESQLQWEVEVCGEEFKRSMEHIDPQYWCNLTSFIGYASWMSHHMRVWWDSHTLGFESQQYKQNDPHGFESVCHPAHERVCLHSKEAVIPSNIPTHITVLSNMVCLIPKGNTGTYPLCSLKRTCADVSHQFLSDCYFHQTTVKSTF